jgi:hypothetical protein
MVSHRFFQVFGNQSSRWRRLNNGLPQDSVLAPILFNLYMSDQPSSSLNLCQFADDIALTNQSKKFEECEILLEETSKHLVESFIGGGVYVQIYEKLKSVCFI